MTDKLIGTKPNQVPSNSDLGTLAYQNADNVIVNKLDVADSYPVLKVRSVTNSGNNLAISQGTNSYITASSNSNLYISAKGNADLLNLVNGNIGIGTTSPTTALTIRKAIASASYGQQASMIEFKSYYAGYDTETVKSAIYSGVSDKGTLNTEGGYMAFHVNNNGTMAEKLRIEKSGNVGIGITSFSTYGARLNVKMSGGSTNAIIASINSTTSGTRRHIDFFDGSSTSRKGAIETNGTSTTYSTTSDRRLKDNIQPITDATIKLMSMKPVTHTWISSPDEPKVHGFIAQEMQEIVPEAVSGDADSEEMMSMDYGRITPVLVAALQEAHKKISELEERLNDAGL